MPVNENEFLLFAKSLSNETEINRRNIVSRSYYSAYHACFITYKPSQNIEGGTHKKLIESLQSSPARKDKTIGYILDQLKCFRVVSDYFLEADVSIKDSDLAISQTEAIHKKLTDTL